MSAQKLAESLLAYCRAHPNERFWQAVRNWSGHNFIGASADKNDWQDTFYWNNK